MTHADRTRLRSRRPGFSSAAEDGGASPVRQRTGNGVPMPDREITNCASFQRVVVTTLLNGLFEASMQYGAQSVGCGGVSANSRLRLDAAHRGHRAGASRLRPEISLSTTMPQ